MAGGNGKTRTKNSRVTTPTKKETPKQQAGNPVK